MSPMKDYTNLKEHFTFRIGNQSPSCWNSWDVLYATYCSVHRTSEFQPPWLCHLQVLTNFPLSICRVWFHLQVSVSRRDSLHLHLSGQYRHRRLLYRRSRLLLSSSAVQQAARPRTSRQHHHHYYYYYSSDQRSRSTVQLSRWEWG